METQYAFRFYYWFFFMFLLTSCFQSEINKRVEKEKTTVVAIYPTSDTLPENLLRFYIQFSQSMKVVNNLEHVKSVNEEGATYKKH